MPLLLKTGGRALHGSREGDFFISLLDVENGCYAVHVHTNNDEIEYSAIVYLFDDDAQIKTKLGQKGDVNFHRVLLNGWLVSEGVLVRFDKNKSPTKARLEIRVKGGAKIIEELKLIEEMNPRANQ